MENKEFGASLTKAFEAWNNGNPTGTEVANLKKEIEFAAKNGIELTLVIPKSLLDTKAKTKPISRGDAIEHSSGTTEHSILFEIPSEVNMNKIGHSKRLILKAVDNYLDLGPTLLLKRRMDSAGSTTLIGAFVPGEISSLGLK